MKVLYLDCGMGAAGDMLTAALLELIPEKEQFLFELNNLGIPGVTVNCKASFKCGIQGTHITVNVNGVEEDEETVAHSEKHHHHHHHSGLHEIEHIVKKLPLSEKIKEDVMAVYSLIANAESHAHGVSVTDIHFHEVGTMDAVADITAVCILMERLSPDQVIVSPVNVGGGHVRCAHGILPVPAPATAFLLKNVPIYSGDIKSELCTPTGAALLVHFADKFGNMPLMKTSSVGYGMGQKNFDAANCVRAFLGEMDGHSDTVTELCCNLDDMTAESIGFAKEQFFAAGALDVYTVSAQMKKSRPGTILCVLCKESDKAQMLKLFFRHTTTLGVRENVCRRYVLCRTVETVSTEFGDVRKKVSSGFGVTKEKFEYEDIAKIAREHDMTFDEATEYVKKQNK